MATEPRFPLQSRAVARPGRQLSLPALLIIVALGAGLLRQGGYPTGVQWAIGLLLIAAAVVPPEANAARAPTDSAGPTPPSDAAQAEHQQHPASVGQATQRQWLLRQNPGLLPVLAAASALAAWALLTGALHGRPLSGLRPALLLVGLIVVLDCCRRLGWAGRELLAAGLLCLGLIVAASGWLGVVTHTSPLAWPGQGMWRAASTVTYPNAMAAALVPLALLSLAARTERPASRWLGVVGTVLLVGVGATVSRAGLLALATGLVVLAVALRPAGVLRASVAPGLGAAIALLGLLPSLPTTAEPRPALATAALAAGLAVGAVRGPRARSQRRAPGRRALLATGKAVPVAGVIVAAVTIAVAAGLAVTGSGHTVEAAARAVETAWRPVATSRVTLASPDRAAATRAAVRQVASHPVVGSGPGLPELSWSDPSGGHGTVRYVHNEYLQVTVELGLVGAALLAALLLAIALSLLRVRRIDPASRPAIGWAAGCAGAAAFAVHSAFDFVWHLPALPLLVVALIGLALSSPGPTTEDPAARGGSTLTKGMSP